MYSLPNLINHLIILAPFIGWRTCGTVIGKNEFGLNDVGFGNNQKAKPGNTDGDPSLFFFSFYLRLFFCCSLTLKDLIHY